LSTSIPARIAATNLWKPNILTLDIWQTMVVDEVIELGANTTRQIEVVEEEK